MSDFTPPVPPEDDPPEDEEDEIGRDGADAAGRARVRKAPNAFRTISEVADDLHIPQHVLRFWETKFPRVKPMKRGGGRRYYRPDDIALLRQISDLLYTQGYTIKGVQRLLREGGGHLSGDIPPPPDDERAAPAADGEETPPPPASRTERQPPLRRELPERVAETIAAVPYRAPPRRRPDPEAERLRAVLTETLDTLLALRSLLP